MSKRAAAQKAAEEAAKNAPKLGEYTAKADGWIAGFFWKKGDLVWLTESQAKYENVAPAKPLAETKK